MKKFIDQFGIEYPLEGKENTTLIIGRSPDCDIVIPPKDSEYRNLSKCPGDYLSVSRRHALFDLNNQTIRDLSTYGTIVDSKKLTPDQSVPLNHLSHLKFGRLELTYCSKE
jgi:pSer/pThr/pTyr-binding forkhead associated (FHA) protein